MSGVVSRKAEQLAQRTTQEVKSEGEKKGEQFYNPVDRGWSWVILACVVFNQMICIGFLKSFGVLFVGIQQAFGASASQVSLIAGIQSGTFSLSAVVTLSFLIDLMPVRRLVMLGGLIAASGVSLSFFADSVYFLVGSQALCVGFGFSMIFGPGFILLSKYFVKRRPLAAAIGNAGGSLGALIVPFLTRVLLDEFGLSGCYLLLGGVFAQVLVSSCFFTPPSDYKLRGSGQNCEDGARVSLLGDCEHGEKFLEDGSGDGIRTENSQTGTTVENSKSVESDDTENTKSTADQHENEKILENGDTERSKDIVQRNNGLAKTETETWTFESESDVQPLQSDSDKQPLQSDFEMQPFAQNVASATFRANGSISVPNNVSPLSNDAQELTNEISPQEISLSYNEVHHLSSISRPRAFSDSQQRNSGMSTNEQSKGNTELSTKNHGASIEMYNSANSLRKRDFHASSEIRSGHIAGWKKESLSALNCDALHFGSSEVVSAEVVEVTEISTTDDSEQSRNKCVKFCKSIDTSLFKKPLFWLILLYHFFGMVGVGIPLILLPPLALEKGFSMTDGALLVMISGAVDIIGRLLPGFVAQMKWLRPQTMQIMAFLLQGVLFQLVSFFTSLPTMMILAVLHGLSAGVFPSMMQLIIIDFMGLQHFPRAFGFAQLTIGMSGAMVLPFMGYLRDRSGTYVTPFHVLGASVLVALVFLLAEPLARRLDSKMNSK